MLDKKKRKSKSICIGTGLIALDLVTNGDEARSPRLWAGGSCGNVLTILAYLGWKSYPIARLGDDEAAKAVAKDMAKYGVDFKYVSFDSAVHTPIILQRILITPNGHPTHRFYWICPNCGNWFPSYSPIRLQDINLICENSLKATYFYFDRVSPASIKLAEKAKKEGTIVVFEPTSIKDDKNFRKAVTLCDVLKYSNERASNSPKMAYESQARLVVETLGAEGLRYRLRENKRFGKWKLLKAFRVQNLKDAAGAGDWCTAGMIDSLASVGTSFDYITENTIINSLRYGQALSALNCAFEGARGVMYGVNKSNFNKEVQSILKNEETSVPLANSLTPSVKKRSQCLCPACQRHLGKKQ